MSEIKLRLVVAFLACERHGRGNSLQPREKAEKVLPATALQGKSQGWRRKTLKKGEKEMKLRVELISLLIILAVGVAMGVVNADAIKNLQPVQQVEVAE